MRRTDDLYALARPKSKFAPRSPLCPSIYSPLNTLTVVINCNRLNPAQGPAIALDYTCTRGLSFLSIRYSNNTATARVSLFRT